MRANVSAYAVPVSGTVCGLLGALSAMVSIPDRDPVEVGEKVTRTVQAAPDGSVVGQVLVSEKSPLADMARLVRLPFPVFQTVRVWGRLAVPTSWLVNLSEEADRVTLGGVPVPLKAT